MPNVGVIIGRFQVPSLSLGHRSLIDYAMSQHDRVVILVGVAPKISKRNPLPYPVVSGMLADYVCANGYASEVVDIPFLDGVSSTEWSERLDHTLSNLYPGLGFTLYAGRDSYQAYYSGRYKVTEVPLVVSPSGTEMRERTLLEPYDTVEYRTGLIAAHQADFDKVYPVVDVAVLDAGRNMVLMGRKRTEEGAGYRFIGGFVDPKDVSLEQTVRREVAEEADIEVDNVRYVTSAKIADWRYRNTNDSVMSSFFVADYIFGNYRAKDDIAELKWVLIADLHNQILPLHRRFALDLQNFIVPERQ